MLVPFARQSKASTDALGYSGERLVNWFLRPTDGLSTGALMSRSGLVEEATGIGPVRAMISFNSALFVVGSSGVFRFSGSVLTQMTGVPIPDGIVNLAASEAELAIVAGGRYFICDGATVTEHTTGSVTDCTGVAFQDGYFLVIGSNGTRSDALTISGLRDGKTFNALDFVFAESGPDGLRGIVADHGEVWLFGSESIEVFYNSGDADFPFERNRSALVERGCLNGAVIAKEDNAVFWVGPDRVVYRSGGGTPQVISTREIEETLKSVTAENIECGFTFSDRGHKFYAICVEGKPTLCFDLTTGFWSERSSGVDIGEWLCTDAAVSGGIQYLGTSDGRIVTQDAAKYTDAGALFRNEAVSIPIEQQGQQFSIAKIHMNVAMGSEDWYGQWLAARDTTGTATLTQVESTAIGLNDTTFTATEQDAQAIHSNGATVTLTESQTFALHIQENANAPLNRPEVVLEASRDGRNWGREKRRELGALGEYWERVTWHALGLFRRAQFKIWITDAVPRDIYGVHYE